MELRGEGGPVDVEDALKWTRFAAEAGNAVALNNLGRMLELGLGLTADGAMALDYYRRAAEAGDPTAADNLKRLGG
jgi:TPR repeat protein